MKQIATAWGIREKRKMFRIAKKGGEQVMKKGFTLIELLIVIAILGILVALILPRFADVRSDANAKVCIANLRGLVAAMATYETRYNQEQASWTMAKLVDSGFLAAAPVCPEGGTYTLTANTSPDADGAACSVAGHVWP